MCTSRHNYNDNNKNNISKPGTVKILYNSTRAGHVATNNRRLSRKMTQPAETINPSPQLLANALDHCSSPIYGQTLSESEYGNLLSPETNEEQHDENTNPGSGRRSSWIARSPFKNNTSSINNISSSNFVRGFETVFLPDRSSTSKSPVRDDNRDAGATTTPPKMMQLGEKLMNSISKRTNKMKQQKMN